MRSLNMWQRCDFSREKTPKINRNRKNRKVFRVFSRVSREKFLYLKLKTGAVKAPVLALKKTNE
jgi:hypothetical protein